MSEEGDPRIWNSRSRQQARAAARSGILPLKFAEGRDEICSPSPSRRDTGHSKQPKSAHEATTHYEFKPAPVIAVDTIAFYNDPLLSKGPWLQVRV